MLAIDLPKAIIALVGQTFGDKACHPEYSEGSLRPASEILRCAQDDILPIALLIALSWRFLPTLGAERARRVG